MHLYSHNLGNRVRHCIWCNRVLHSHGQKQTSLSSSLYAITILRCVLANTVSGDNISGNVGLLHKMLGAVILPWQWWLPWRYFQKKREVELELSMLIILRAITW